ncbi:MAG: alpha/beta fold hydrolase [Pseudomonadota bacterium]
MANFVLVHGGCHGAWCWESCIDQLRQRGHRAAALDLPGSGADSTPRQNVAIADYTRAICALVESQSERVVLVGHSIAGATLASVASMLSDEVAALIYVAAFVPKPGERLFDLIPADRREVYLEQASKSADNTLRVGFEVARARFFNDLSREQARTYYNRLTPQALSVYFDRAEVDPTSLACQRSYIICLQDKTIELPLSREHALRSGGRVFEIDAAHDVMLSCPELLVRCLENSLGEC